MNCRQLTRWLARLEAPRVHAKRMQFLIRYFGDPEPAEVTPSALVLWLHQPWCTTTAHPGGCEPRAVGEESSYASL
jgi:hypothetical protein